MTTPLSPNYGPGNVDEILTTTLVNMIPGIRDNIFRSNPVFKWLYEGKYGGKMKLKGGAQLSHGVMYAKNDTAQSYARYDLLNTTPADGLTRDQWDWAQYSVSVSLDGFEQRVINNGEQKIEDIMEVKKMQAEESLSTLFEQHFFQSVPGAKDIRSFPSIIASSGTEGDINGTTNTWWASTVTSSGSFAAQGVADLTTLFNTLAVQNPVGGPEMFVSDQTAYEAYEASLRPHERFTDNKMADIGIINIKFKDTPWTWSVQANSGVIYALHSKGLEFAVNSGTDFITTDFVKPYNQDAKVAQILVACSLMTGNRRKLGKITGVTA